jgi:cytochrome c oxidase assembly protein subunit 15
MGMALIILLGLIILLYFSQKKAFSIPANNNTKVLAWLAVLLTLFQIVLGTQVRQFVDLQMHESPDQWLDPAPLKFYVHRSLSLLVLGTHLIIFTENKKKLKGIQSDIGIDWSGNSYGHCHVLL